MEQDIRTQLNAYVESPFLEEALEQVKQMPEVPQWLTAEFVADLEEKFALLGQNRDAAFASLEQVAGTPVLRLFAKVLYCLVRMWRGYSKTFTKLELPQMKGAEYVGLFPILGLIPESNAVLEKRGVPQDVIYDTLNFLRYSMEESTKTEGRFCFNKKAFTFYTVVLFTKYLWMGRMRFEIHTGFDRNVQIFANKDNQIRILMRDTMLHAGGNILGAIGCTDEEGAYDADFRETDTYYEGYGVNPETGLAENIRTRLSKAEWRTILQPGDALLKIHIPFGGKLTRQACEEAYAKAREVFPRCYPEYDFKGFIGNTWLFCPELKKVLKPDSNTVLFQNDYHIFPAKNQAQDVFLYVYDQEVASADDVDFAGLPENNSMQRGVKQLLLEGKYIHQFNGFKPL